MSEAYPFHQSLEIVLKSISLSPSEYKMFCEHSKIVKNAFLSALLQRNPAFGLASYGQLLNCTFSMENKTGLPNKFDEFIVQINLPCKLRPIRDPDEPSNVRLQLLGHQPIKHVCIVDGYVNREQLQTWFGDNIKAVIDKLQYVLCDKHPYTLKYLRHGYGESHTIEASNSKNSNQIIFDILPGFKFAQDDWNNQPVTQNTSKNWFAVPSAAFNDARLFVRQSSRWKHLVKPEQQNLKNALLLMKAYFKTNKLKPLNKFATRVFLNDIQNCGVCIIWNYTPDEILLRMLYKMKKWLVGAYFWNENQKRFGKLDAKIILHYTKALTRFARKLEECRNNNSITSTDCLMFFGRT